MIYDLYTQQEKIMTWNKKNIEDLINGMTVEELIELSEMLPDEASADEFRQFIYRNAASILYEYTWRWLKDLGDDRVLHEQESVAQLFEAAIAISRAFE